MWRVFDLMHSCCHRLLLFTRWSWAVDTDISHYHLQIELRLVSRMEQKNICEQLQQYSGNSTEVCKQMKNTHQPLQWSSCGHAALCWTCVSTTKTLLDIHTAARGKNRAMSSGFSLPCLLYTYIHSHNEFQHSHTRVIEWCVNLNNVLVEHLASWMVTAHTTWF